MPQNRFFIDAPFEKGKTVTFPPSEKHHLTVMRCKINDQVELINGRNQLARATILSLTTDSAELEINDIHTAEAPNVTVNLYQAFCHYNRLDTILEKCVELGASGFYLFSSSLSEIKIPANRDHRLKKVITSAMKQCGRLDLPKLHLLKKMDAIEKPKGLTFFGDIRENSEYLTKAFSKNNSYNIFIGPEKGFTAKEIQFLENSFEAKGIHLHPNILRTDTAAICFLSQLQLLIHS